MQARSWRWAATAVVALVAPLGAALATGLASVHRCVPVDGSWGALTVRLSLVRPDGACPVGTMAIDGGHALSGAVVVTMPVLALHLISALGLAAVIGVARTLLARAADRVLPRLPARPTAVPEHAPAAAVRVPLTRPVAWLRPALQLRGPPSGPLGALLPS